MSLFTIDRKPMTLRPYQQAAVDAVYQHLREREDNPCVVCPTGAGKSLIIAQICSDVVKQWDGRVLILAHVKELLEQATDKLHAMAPDLWQQIGVYSAGLRSRDTDHSIIVAGIQSVYRRAAELDRFDMVLIDECFVAGTRILTPSGTIPIEQVQPGMFVRNAEGMGTVEAVSARPARHLVTLEYDDDTVLTCTANHPIFTDRGWRAAGSLAIGSLAFGIESVRMLRQGLSPLDQGAGRRQPASAEGEAVVEAEVLLDLLRENRMSKQKTAYELSRSQVSTPADVVRLFWRVTREYRDNIGRVLDLGAGDGRFAIGGQYDRYEGIEIDTSRNPAAALPENAAIKYGCVFDHKGHDYDACIGNPPYVRDHDLNRAWRDAIASRIEAKAGIAPNRKGNLYLYFMFLAILKARSDGLVASIIPYEWVSRPSAKPLRDFILTNRWKVDTYRFTEPVFDKVLTTASLTIVDKACNTGEWSFYQITREGSTKQLKTPTGSRYRVLSYEQRGQLWAMRGMSPGTQKVFTLTEGERVHAGLTMKDVTPCVTTLRGVPATLARLTRPAFNKWFVQAGAKCWLIKSHEHKLTSRVAAYLDSIPEKQRSTSTCIERTPWYRYPMFDTPALLVNTGFTSYGPKVLINSVNAKAVGSVCGIYSSRPISLTKVRDYLRKIRFEGRVVPHAKQLKKIEIRQMNAVLNQFINTEMGNG